MAESVKRQVRHFTGQVSQKAVAAGGTGLRLEHYKRIQTTLTKLVDRHQRENRVDPEEFVRTLLEYEQVHIVTVEENYDAMRAKGDYEQARIVLVPWNAIPAARQEELWRKMLRGKVSNAKEYAPMAPRGA
ncbi:hypothetical protein [Rhodoferax sp. U11-2br]|uniref:hypothetical protein n=1 Tax=Rhodoferax sp. U11-2br TaxID=2838878 RepID=UPI001BE677BE|nr:hypothetical protein [Rhodoferax sp. U11-2br]MBT3065881.1 hypothetical protein [Rhodoferax sp. U11-2br]